MTYQPGAAAEDILNRALTALESGDEGLFAALDSLPAPIYVTDADGVITYFNSACIDFSGRKPQVGVDRWCVTWKLYTGDGTLLPHDQCPMAQTIRTKSEVRGVRAIAERPDGTRVNFLPYPTPLFDKHGELRGAVNMLIDVTERRQAAALLEQAARCHRLARSIANTETIRTLELLAAEYEAKAILLESGK